MSDQRRAGSPTQREYWQDRPVVVTGGASFLGSHLVERLIAEDARVTVIDNLTSGHIYNIGRHVHSGAVTFSQGDLRRSGVAESVLAEADTVFHLAAAYGGRGYLQTHQRACAENVLLDAQVLAAAARRGVRKLVYASSAHVYPCALQQDPSRPVALREDMAGPPYQPDGMHGWAKLTGELTLATLYREHGLCGVACRYFAIYGPRAKETSALIALMARALLGQNPMRVWGDGTQRRSWCYVTDAVEATLRAAQRIDDASAVNIGATEATTVLDAARLVMRTANHHAPIEPDPQRPTGPPSRTGDFIRAKAELDWCSGVPLEDGLRRTYGWYAQSRGRRISQLQQQLDTLLFEQTAHLGSAPPAAPAQTAQPKPSAGDHSQ